MRGVRVQVYVYAVMILILILASAALYRGEANTLVYTGEEPYIVRPFYGLPAVAMPGDELDVLVRTDEPLNIESVVMYGFNVSYRMEIVSVGGVEDYSPEENLTYKVQRVTVKVPEDADPGLYTLAVEYQGGEAVMPRSLIVGQGPEGHIRVVHITDQHFGATNKGIPNTYKNTRYIALINTIARSHGAGLVLVTGDQIDVGSDMASHKDYFSQMNQLLIPTVIVPGNHDWAQVSTLKSFLEYLYGRYQNSLRYWSFSYGDFIFIGIDTRGIGYPEDEQLDFLEKVLAENSDKKAVIMFHHPLFNRAGFYKGDPESFRGNLYSSWRELGWDQAKRFFEILENHGNVLAVFSGHVHRDADAVWTRSDGSRVYFITTTTANHGYPEGYYWGMKIVDLYTNGTVKVYIPSGRPYFFKSGSLNTERFMVIEHVDPYSKAVTWSINTTGFQDLETSNITLVFYMNKTVDPSQYKFYGSKEPLNVEYYDIGIYHLFIVEVNASTPGTITLASYMDDKGPNVEISGISPKRPRQGKIVTFSIKAWDDGWGVKDVYMEIVKPDGSREEVKGLITNTKGLYLVVYRVSEPGHYTAKAYAIDFNGNKGESKIVEFDVKGKRTTTTTTETATETTETTVTTTTTTTQTTYTTTTTTTTTTSETTTETTTQATTTTTRETTTQETSEATTPAGAQETGTTTTIVVEEGKPPVWVLATIIIVALAVLAAVVRARR